MESTEEKEISLQDLFSIFRRRQWIVYGTVIAFGLLAVVYCLVCTRKYEATGSVQMQKESTGSMGLESMMSGAAESAGDALGANVDLQTEANILQSDTLALRTIEALKLESTSDFKKKWNPVGSLMGVFSSKGVVDPVNASLEDSPQRRLRDLNIFRKNLKVKPVGGTRLIEIDYESSDPKLAAAVVNQLTQALVNYNFETRYDATNQTTKWLSDQIGDLRKNSEDLQAKVVDLERQSGVYGLNADSADGQGRQGGYSEILDRLQQATTAMSMAEQNRILKGAIARAAQSGNAEMLSGLAGNTVVGNSQALNNALGLIQTLREQESTIQASLSQAQAKYGPAYEKVVELKNQLNGVQHSIQNEVKRIQARAQSDYEIAVQTESGSRQQYERVKAQADSLNDNAIKYAIARQDAIESRTVYEDLFRRLKEAGVLQNLKPSNITVVDPGRVPAKPKKPNVPLYIAIALGAGFFCGTCGAFLTDVLDSKIKTVVDLESLTGKTVLGAVPFVKQFKDKDGWLSMVQEPHSLYSEAVRSVRTALLLSQTERPPKVVLVTSSIAGEGKSTFSTNLAVVLAQQGYKVLLVDADLRRGLLAERFGLVTHGVGLSSLLCGSSKFVSIFPYDPVPNLCVLPKGPVPPNPSELLDSKIFKNNLEDWRDTYDFVIIDGAPILPVTDSVALNALSDMTLYVVRANFADKVPVKRGYAMLTREGKQQVSFVINGVVQSDHSYYGYGYKNKYGYEGTNEQN